MKPKEPQQKQCGNPKCEKTFLQFNSLDKYCSGSCKRIMQGEKEKGVKVESKKFRELKSHFDMRSKSTTELEHESKDEVQFWVKQRDIDKACISCGSGFQIQSNWHGGHCFKAETHSGVQFDEENI